MSITLTQRSLISSAFTTLGVTQPGEAPDADNLATAQDRLAELVDNWNTQDLTVLVVERVIYSLVANQQTYTIGPAALTPDFSTGTAARPMDIQGANLVQNVTGTPVFIPLAPLTDDMYQNLPVPSQTSFQPNSYYYNATNPLGTVFLWPAPTTSVNQLALYLSLLTPQFASLDASYICPPGYAKAFRLGLAQALITDFGVPLETAAKVDQMASQALTDLKMTNVKMSDIAVDPAFAPDPRGLYNIQSDTGGGWGGS